MDACVSIRYHVAGYVSSTTLGEYDRDPQLHFDNRFGSIVGAARRVNISSVTSAVNRRAWTNTKSP